MQGYIHSIETGGMVDGPGVRCVVFFQGCPLRCRYCHNPDTWRPTGGRPYSLEALMREVEKYRSYFKFSGGGVTVSGGDPFMQPVFLNAFLQACKAEGIHTAVDTSGQAEISDAENVFEYTDLLLLDFKSFTPESYKRVTGVSIDRMLATLDLSAKMKIPTWIRFVLVPGLTDNLQEIRDMADYLRPFKHIEKVEVMPFHKMGEHKWEALKIPYELTETEPPDAELLAQVRAILTL